MKNKKRHWDDFALVMFVSIFTLGIFNLMMYLADDINPKDFFGDILKEGII